MLSATRVSCSSGRPIQKSSPRGSATCVRKNVPSEWPVTRRTTSPAKLRSNSSRTAANRGSAVPWTVMSNPLAGRARHLIDSSQTETLLRYVSRVKGDRAVMRPRIVERQLAARNERHPVTRADLLHAARHRFLRSERGDMNELARELGIGRATLYRWVGSRDRLLGEVLWSLAELGLAQARIEAKGRGAAWVLAVYSGFGDLIIDLEPLRHFVKSEPECALRVMTSKASPLQRRVVNTFCDVLVEARERRGLRLRLDPETLAFAMVRIAESFLWTDLITGETPDLTKAREVTKVLLT